MSARTERFFRAVRGQFLVEVEQRGIDDLDELRELFTAWLERRYHRRTHSETGQSPLERFLAEPAPEVPGPAGRIQQRCRLLCQVGELDSQRGGQLADEPPFSSSAPVPSSRSATGGATPRASQIASLTSTTCRDTSTNRR